MEKRQKRDEAQVIMSKADADDGAMKEKLNAVYRLRLLLIVVKSYGNISESRVVVTIPLVVLEGKMPFCAGSYFMSWSVSGMTKRALFLMGC